MNTRAALSEPDIAAQLLAMGRAARAAQRPLALAPAEQKRAALAAAAAAIRADSAAILSANARDVASARAAGQPESFIDRLTLSAARIEAMADSVRLVADLPDPVGAVTVRV